MHVGDTSRITRCQDKKPVCDLRNECDEERNITVGGREKKSLIPGGQKLRHAKWVHAKIKGEGNVTCNSFEGRALDSSTDFVKCITMLKTLNISRSYRA